MEKILLYSLKEVVSHQILFVTLQCRIQFNTNCSRKSDVEQTIIISSSLATDIDVFH